MSSLSYNFFLHSLKLCCHKAGNPNYRVAQLVFRLPASITKLSVLPRSLRKKHFLNLNSSIENIYTQIVTRYNMSFLTGNMYYHITTK